MPEKPAFGCAWFGWLDGAVVGCVEGRGGGAGLLFDDDALDPDDLDGIVGFLALTGATLAGAGSFHALFTSLMSQLFVE